MDELSRRVVLHRILQLTASIAAVPAVLGTAAAADTCVNPDSESLRSSLHYVNPSPKPAEMCKGCGFFAGDTGKPACGNCQIMTGPVDAGAHCDSWAAKS
jgi:hypothetical protein